jgi:hypothetical protein
LILILILILILSFESLNDNINGYIAIIPIEFGIRLTQIVPDALARWRLKRPQIAVGVMSVIISVTGRKRGMDHVIRL